MQKLDLGELEPCLRHRHEAHALDVMQLLLLTYMPATGTRAFPWRKAPSTGWNIVESRQCPRVSPGTVAARHDPVKRRVGLSVMSLSLAVC